LTPLKPFKKDYPINPSWEIARSLPAWLPPLRTKQPLGKPSSIPTPFNPPPPAAPAIPPVRLVVHDKPIRVNYETVRGVVPRLWEGAAIDSAGGSGVEGGDGKGEDGKGGGVQEGEGKEGGINPAIDLMLHIGMAGPRLFYAVERRGHRDGYVMGDVDGEVPAPREEVGEGWIWEGMPPELLTDVDVEDVLRRWRGHSPRHMDLRISEDAGHYMCDFIYFSSLAYLYKAGEKRRVLFLHVPSDASEHSIATGRELVLQLVRSVVESEVVRREKAKEEGKVEGAAV
ncbi:Pyroglutamyl-peptidase 1, partial [Staphylotrichum tortipilum]